MPPINSQCSRSLEGQTPAGRVLVGRPHGQATQEYISANIFDQGPTRVQVTSAVYVTPEEIQAGGRFLSDVLARGLGFVEP